jgi:hypothetical protein
MSDKDQLKTQLKNMTDQERYDYTIKQETEWFAFGSLSAKQTCSVIRSFNQSLNRKAFPESFVKVGYVNW